MADDAMSDYPVTFDVAYPEFPNRWLILVRWLLALPHYVVLYFLGLIAALVWVVSFFTILVAGTYPDSLYRFMVGVTRWSLNVNAYVLFLDRYPPFSMDAADYEEVTFTVEKPDFNRWLVLVKWLLVIPHLIVLTVLGVIALVAALLLAIGVLVMGRYPPRALRLPRRRRALGGTGERLHDVPCRPLPALLAAIATQGG